MAAVFHKQGLFLLPPRPFYTSRYRFGDSDSIFAVAETRPDHKQFACFRAVEIAAVGYVAFGRTGRRLYAGRPVGSRAVEKCLRLFGHSRKVGLQLHGLHGAVFGLYPFVTEHHIGFPILHPQGAVECHPIHGSGDKSTERSEWPFRSVGTENLGAAPGVFSPSLFPLFPFNVAVDGGKQIIFAVIPVHLRSPDGSGQPVVGRDAHHLSGAVPVLKVAALEHLDSSAHLSVGHNRVGGAIHVIDSFHTVGEYKRVADVDFFDVQG